MTHLPPLFWKLFSNGCYLVPFFESSLGMLGVISNGVRRPALPVAFVASRSVLEFFGRCVLAGGGCYWNSRGDASSGEPRRKWVSPACNQYFWAIFLPILAQRSSEVAFAFAKQRGYRPDAGQLGSLGRQVRSFQVRSS